MSNNGTLENTTPIEIVEKVSSANNTWLPVESN
jgi:hypothetical protein